MGSAFLPGPRLRLIALKRCASLSRASIFSSSRVILDLGSSVPRNFSSALSTESLVVSAIANLTLEQNNQLRNRRRCDCEAVPAFAVGIPCQYQDRFRAGRNACSLLHRYRHSTETEGSLEPDCGSTHPYDNPISVLQRCYSCTPHNCKRGRALCIRTNDVGRSSEIGGGTDQVHR